MRKSSNRKQRPIAKPLTTKQLQDILIGPRLHIQMLISGNYEHAYTASVAGVLNIASILTSQKGQTDIQKLIDLGQLTLLNLIDNCRTPSVDEANTLLESFNLASLWIARTNTTDLARALQYSDRELGKE